MSPIAETSSHDSEIVIDYLMDRIIEEVSETMLLARSLARRQNHCLLYIYLSCKKSRPRSQTEILCLYQSAQPVDNYNNCRSGRLLNRLLHNQCCIETNCRINAVVVVDDAHNNSSFVIRDCCPISSSVLLLSFTILDRRTKCSRNAGG